MIQLLLGHNVETEVDPNPNGYPILIIQHRYGGRIISSMHLGQRATEELIAELQKRLVEIKE